MTDRPIRMNAVDVLAALAGRKTQLRLPITGAPNDKGWHCDRRNGRLFFVASPGAPSMPVHLPFQTGDRLWVREGWQLHARASDFCTVLYRASIEAGWGWTASHEMRPDHLAQGMSPKPFQSGWRALTLMPRWASRLTLIATDVRVHRLQDIARDDVIAEGLTTFEGQPISGMTSGYHQPFARRYSDQAWVRNPWVAALTFTVRHDNIDAPLKSGELEVRRCG